MSNFYEPTQSDDICWAFGVYCEHEGQCESCPLFDDYYKTKEVGSND